MSGEVLTVACGQPFLKVLARGLLDGCFAPAGSSPDVLAETTVLLPTRRACRTLSTLLLEEADRSAVLMPRIRPLVPGEDGAAGLAGDATFSSFFSAPSASQSGDVVQEDTGEITPAIPQLERRLVLMQFVMRWLASARVEAAGRASGYDAADLSAVTPAQALRLADDLAALMDEVTEEGADLTRLAADLPVEFASHWQRTLEFLAIMTETFPAYLLATDRVTSSTHAAQTLARDAEHTRKHGLTAPVVIAGIASVRALAAPLIAAVAEDDHGVIILPGLDRELDRETWNALAGERDGMQGLQEAQPEHPQAGIARLLSTMGRKRDDVGDLFLRDGRATIMRADSEAHDPPRETPRVRLLSEALLPADVTDHWQTLATRFSGDDVALALDGLEVIETAGIDEEADVAALILREAIETPEATAVLVTPDRAIARRVRQRLERWGIFVDDTAGRPLGQTVPGTFLDLIVACIDSQFAPSATMALLQHPLTRLGLDRGVVREAARALELLAFRQTYLGAGLAAMRAALTRASVSPVGDTTFVHPVIERLSSEARAAADDLLVQIEAAVAPMMDIDTSGEEMPLRAHVRAHVEVAEAFARDAAGDSSNLWQGDAGEAACTLLSEVLGDDSADVPLVAGDYSSVFRALFAGEVVRPRRPGHPRIAIYGVLEARLQHADTVVLAGLNEGTWPKPADPDPWVNRPMRAEVGLPAPEVRIGQAAHDFVQLASGLSVVLTRSARVDGVPTVPSRWLMRLEAVLGGLAAAYPQSGAQDVFGKATTRAPALRWARAFREVPAHAPRPAPAPSPPVARRPRKLSVTRIEAWLANPYSVFARSILRLTPLDPLDALPDASVRGRIIHHALHRFTVQHPEALPPATADALMAIAHEMLDAYVVHPRVAAFWEPRLRRFAEWFAETEVRRRVGIARIFTEVDGARAIATPGGEFTVTARADRIDLEAAGRARIYDYKTGAAPTASQVIGGMSPQLPLEAAILDGGGFEGLAGVPVSALAYVSATGGTPAGKHTQVAGEGVTADASEVGTSALAALRDLVIQYDDPAMPYRALRRPQFTGAYRYDDYAHLARVAEWSSTEENGGGDGGR